ncbi:hypothetical protein YC2023_075844 [Brassica napus]
MGEVRDVMLQYTMSTEREARKERVRQAEERGQMEEAAIHMVRACLTSPSANQIAPLERTPASQRLGPTPPLQAATTGVITMEPLSGPRERLPVSLHLGLSLQAEAQRRNENDT